MFTDTAKATVRQFLDATEGLERVERGYPSEMLPSVEEGDYSYVRATFSSCVISPNHVVSVVFFLPRQKHGHPALRGLPNRDLRPRQGRVAFGVSDGITEVQNGRLRVLVPVLLFQKEGKF